MADWRQIQARIRKAKNSSDPPGQLAELYQRTRDAMVAFELAQFHEKAGNGPAAAQWYTSAAERFRRAQWRTKAEEALTRLGAAIPPASAESAAPSGAAELSEAHSEKAIEQEESAPSVAEEEHEAVTEASAATETSDEPTEEQPASSAQGSTPGDQQKRKRRRGRRGGRGRRGKGGRIGKEAAATSAQPVPHAAPARTIVPPVPQPVHEEHQPEFVQRPMPEPGHQPAGTASLQSRTRAGDPALASRISQLESQLRRLLACPHASLDEAEQAPAGPGVLILSDSDQVTHYYVEACQTLRIGIGNLLRTGRGDSVRLKERMAENLGIAESRVSKYLKDHCSVRWLQLDDGARELAHFAISVLRPAVNE